MSKADHMDDLVDAVLRLQNVLRNMGSRVSLQEIVIGDPVEVMPRPHICRMEFQTALSASPNYRLMLPTSPIGEVSHVAGVKIRFR